MSYPAIYALCSPGRALSNMCEHDHSPQSLQLSVNSEPDPLNRTLAFITHAAGGSDHRGSDDEGEGNDAGRSGTGLATATAKPKLAKPPLFKVILLNDDYTPMEFVVHVIQKFFAYDLEKATRIMLTVHTEGAATAGIFPRDVAETKSEQINQYAQDNHHPLKSTIEMTD